MFFKIGPDVYVYVFSISGRTTVKVDTRGAGGWGQFRLNGIQFIKWNFGNAPNNEWSNFCEFEAGWWCGVDNGRRWGRGAVGEGSILVDVGEQNTKLTSRPKENDVDYSISSHLSDWRGILASFPWPLVSFSLLLFFNRCFQFFLFLLGQRHSNYEILRQIKFNVKFDLHLWLHQLDEILCKSTRIF